MLGETARGRLDQLPPPGLRQIAGELRAGRRGPGRARDGDLLILQSCNNRFALLYNCILSPLHET
jgi:hypothetical protein